MNIQVVTAPEMAQLVTLTEAAKIFGIGRTTMHNVVVKGQLPAKRIPYLGPRRWTYKVRLEDAWKWWSCRLHLQPPGTLTLKEAADAVGLSYATLREAAVRKQTIVAQSPSKMLKSGKSNTINGNSNGGAGAQDN